MSPPPGIVLRPAEPRDDDFLFQVYASTRADELAMIGWDAEQKRAFLEQQFIAQQAAYSGRYPKPDFQVIELDGVPVGRLYVARLPDEIRLLDIALLPQYRGRGIGGGLVGDLIGDARAQAKPLRLYVDARNPACSLFERLGFTLVAEEGVYQLLEWRRELEGG
jgi:ribosomal protein S18 acetylase RimI-like enzyme